MDPRVKPAGDGWARQGPRVTRVGTLRSVS